ncbi:MAG: beta-glucosidase [Rhodoglobus sp.]|nr:beta-glucosidase [Rhodoglobus sp.]
MSPSISLPGNFLFGAATAAFQIEGAARSDGRTDSVWDTFCRVPGAVINGDDGLTATDHYHRYPEDIRIMTELGLDAYRFSVSWSRVRPGHGAVNPKGIAFYDSLVDSLLEAGLDPWLTLYHWDLPQELEDLGGWANRDTAERFVEYALDVHAALGDRVTRWTTLNEPWCAAFLGYGAGAHAPGRQDATDAIAAAHHLLLAHGGAVHELRAADPSLTLGVTLNLSVIDPADPADASDVDAARRIDGQINRVFLDPLFRGAYADDVLEDLAALWPQGLVHDGDLALIAEPIDFLGVNYYHGESVSRRPAASREELEAPTDRPTSTPFPAAEGVFFHPRHLPMTSMAWEVQPEGLTRLLKRVHDDYTAAAGTALYVTENGAAYDDAVASDGAVHDAERVEYVEAHLAAVADAIDAGVDVRGYFYWSLLDNFEWAWGYAKRFGIVRVDYDTLERTIKDSGRAYAAVIAATKG